MPLSEKAESAVPVFPCVSVDETLDFYRVLGFEVTYKQTSPYVYLAVRRGGFDLHFFGGKDLDPKKAFSMCLVMVSEVESYHAAFVEALREKYGKIPTAGLPRITRFRKGQSRFTVVDPSGNSIVYIRRDEPEVEYGGSKKLSGLARAIDNAAILRDKKEDDKAAAKVLDVALARYPEAPAIDRARALAARAELALAMGDAARAQALRVAVQQIQLTEEDRRRFRHELEAADELERSLMPRGGRDGDLRTDPE